MEITESESTKEVSKSILNFTRDVCKIFRESIKENYICSPLSAHVVLSVAAYGADENTALEMRKVLYICYPDSKLLEEYQKLVDCLNIDENKIQLGSENAQCVATLANKIYISNDIMVNEDYENALDTYLSKSEALDFFKKEESAEIINDWCTEKTHGKISDIVKPDEFTDKTALILINTVYFKGKWLHAFKLYTIPKAFYSSIFKKIKVPTMFITEVLNYRNLRKLNAKAVRLNFMRSEKYMEIIIPNRINGLKTIVKNLDKISEKEFKSDYIRLWLPKFNVKSEIQFVDHLTKMGMIDAFDKVNANFNKICNKELFIKTVLQNAFIIVDELGCEAAAVTEVSGCIKKSLRYSTRRPITIRANRPFLFRIMDSKLNIPLLIGTVVNPIG